MTITDSPPVPHDRLPITPFDPSAVRLGDRRSRLKATLVSLDAAAIAVAWTTALVLFSTGPGVNRSVAESLVVAALATVGSLVGLSQFGLYLSRVNSIRTAEVAGISKLAVLATLGGLATLRVLDLPYQRVEPFLGGLLTGLLLLMGRSGFRIWLQGQRRAGKRCRSVVMIGSNDEAAELVELIGQHPEFGIRIRGVIGDEKEAEGGPIEDLVLGSPEHSVEIMRSLEADGAIVAVSALSSHDLNGVTRELLRNGMHVQITSALRGIDHRRLRAQPIGHEPLFFLEPATLSLWQLAIKRVTDIAMASVLLLLTAPVQLALAIGVKATDGGPIFFRQERVGRHGRTFGMIKLRTMVVDAEARLAELQAQSERSGPLFKMDHDPRFTRLGRFMDATSLNELPQLWNVLRGEMSLVGPRPALPREIASFDDALHARHQVRPGITGLWQVEARDNPAFAAYRRYDLFYVENWSVAFDLVILLATAETVVARMARQLRRKRPSEPAPGASESRPDVVTELSAKSA
ncbi:MAG: sugar transferase [Actinomycetota bacterium]